LFVSRCRFYTHSGRACLPGWFRNVSRKPRRSPMSEPSNDNSPPTDIVIPVYGERPHALAETLSACLKQSRPVGRVFVVDDGSPASVSLPPWAHSNQRISLLRLSQNQGISVARNTGIAQSRSPWIACVNTQVLPDPDWLAACQDALLDQPRAGACYTRLVSCHPDRLLTRWRMRFLETKFADQSGPSDFAPGHAVLFRRQALLSVAGYDARHRLHHEDSDICHRMRAAGWETFYTSASRCVSTQEDTLKQIANKELRESYWYSPSESSLLQLYRHLTKWTIIRAGRNLVTGRLYFLPLDLAIWASALWTASIRTLRHKSRHSKESDDASLSV
jgi:GT2 family glycosyltransferase